MIRLFLFIGLLASLCLAVYPTSATPEPTKSVVNGVLFYSPNCGHCQYVITEVLPAIFEQYGDQLYVIGVDISSPEGQALFLTALQYFNIERGGVPFLIVGEGYLFGSVDIPEKFPGVIEEGLSMGGVDWPPIPGLDKAFASAQPEATLTTTSPPLTTTLTFNATATPGSVTPIFSAPTRTPTPIMTRSDPGTIVSTFGHDMWGNSLALIVLVGMVIALIAGIIYFLRKRGVPKLNPGNRLRLSWMIPALCIFGLGVAGYLSYVESAQVNAVCGPIGDCNTVQQSEYARLFGVLPIGALGVVGYGIILITWIVGQSANNRRGAYTALVICGVSAMGLLFSIYLTFLEPFVIGATCAWCLTSSVIITVIFCLSLAPGRLALAYIRAD